MNVFARLLFALPALLLVALGIGLYRSRGAPDGGGLPSVAAGGFPRTVTLADGLVFDVPAPPRRILLGNSAAVDMVSELVGPGRVAAVPEQAWTYSRLAQDAGAFAGVPSFARFEAETVLTFDPDLVVCDPWAAVETVARLRELGVAVLTLPQVHRLEDVRESLHILGRVLGAEERAAEVVADLNARVAALEASAAGRRGSTAVSYSNSGAGGWSAGEGTTNHELMRLVGLRNLTAEEGRSGHVRMSFEELLALDPDFVVVGDFRPGSEPGEAARFLYGEPALATLTAVREERVLLVSGRLFAASSQELVRGAEELARDVDRALGLGPAEGR